MTYGQSIKWLLAYLSAHDYNDHNRLHSMYTRTASSIVQIMEMPTIYQLMHQDKKIE